MAKRFIDTELFKKPFLRGLEAPLKLLWCYLITDCSPAGIWETEFDVAEARLKVKIEPDKVLKKFEGYIIPFDGGNKWFIPSFLEFQYGTLSPTNPAHSKSINILKKYNLIDDSLKPLKSTLQGTKAEVVLKEEVKAEVKEEEHELQIFSKKLIQVTKLKVQLSKDQSEKLTAEFGIENVKDILQQMDNYKALTTKYVSVYSTALNWLKNRRDKRADPGTEQVGKKDYTATKF